MTNLHDAADLHTFDSTVGEVIADALARLDAIARELADADNTDSVAAMTRTMALNDERDSLYEMIATTLLAIRRMLASTANGDTAARHA